tara:strand:+ start:1886 stop:2056 length:171 start_codon:yes stop_codon:yes gene_type:complete
VKESLSLTVRDQSRNKALSALEVKRFLLRLFFFLGGRFLRYKLRLNFFTMETHYGN